MASKIARRSWLVWALGVAGAMATPYNGALVVLGAVIGWTAAITFTVIRGR